MTVALGAAGRARATPSSPGAAQPGAVVGVLAACAAARRGLADAAARRRALAGAPAFR